jgi:hypothetical protein
MDPPDITMDFFRKIDYINRLMAKSIYLPKDMNENCVVAIQ